MTQEELADRLRVTRRTINSIEGDKYNPSIELAFRMAKLFGVPVEEIFSLDEES
jgi:putative transcriptional regulator